ncbi:MAG: hypothetical protein E2577_00785 [Starkeya sp.]|nr:hypothetical protein [Starkeya sp.]
MMRIRLLRLLLALCALGAALASPVAAARAMAAPGPAVSDPALPCHETALEMTRAALSVTPGQKPAASHLCCVLTQTVVPPLSTPALPVPEAVSARPAVPAETTRAGLAPPIPVPPPRVL